MSVGIIRGVNDAYSLLEIIAGRAPTGGRMIREGVNDPHSLLIQIRDRIADLAEAGGGAGSVTLMKTDGTSEVFQPAADTDLARGAAFVAAATAATGGELLLLGVGTFLVESSVPLSNVGLRGQGASTILKGEVVEGLPPISAAVGTLTISDLTVQVGIVMSGANLNLNGCRVEGVKNGLAAIIRTTGAGTLSLTRTDLRVTGVANSVLSDGTAMTVRTVASTANADVDAFCTLPTPEGFAVNAAYV